MAEADAVSGPAGPDLGSGRLDNAGPANSARSSDALDKALAAALGGQADSADDIPPHLVKAKMEADAAEDAKTKQRAGDKRTSEDARAPESTREAPQPTADPPVNAAKLEAPNHWTPERRKAFAEIMSRIPEPEKAAFADMARAISKDLEGGFTRKSQELSDQSKFADSVRGLFADHQRQQLAQAGLDEVGGIRYLMQLQDYASRDPVNYIRWAMQNTGVTPEHLGFSTAPRQPQQTQQQTSTGDPKLDALLVDPEVAKLRTEFGQFTQPVIAAIQQLYADRQAELSARQQYAQQQQHAGIQTLQRTWNDFRGAQDDHGQLKFPHADALQKQMGAIMETDPEIAAMPDSPAKLDAAYHAALWARPALRTGLLDQEKAAATAAAQRAAEAARAKTAAGARPATGAPTMPAKKGGLDAALDAAFAKHG